MKSEQQFVKLPRGVLESAAWQRLGINARRFVDFSMIEHLRRGGQRNGDLLAPRRQLEEFGIGARHVSIAINEAERAGLVDCKRGVGRRASRFALTWLPLSNGDMPSNRWQMAPEGRSLQMTSEGKHLVLPKGSHKACSYLRREVTKPRNKGIRREAPYKKASYQDGAIVSVGEGGAPGVGVGLRGEPGRTGEQGHTRGEPNGRVVP